VSATERLTLFLLALLLVVAAHLLLAAVALVSRGGRLVSRRTYGVLRTPPKLLKGHD
jgi:hypothetical protein